MKNIRKCLIVLVVAFGFIQNAAAQVPADEIGRALASGNVGAIADYMDNMVVLSIPGSHASYSKSQAEMILLAFFERHKPSSHQMSQKRATSTGGFAIGKLQTSCGVFRTYVAFRGKEGNYKLQELRVEK